MKIYVVTTAPERKPWLAYVLCVLQDMVGHEWSLYSFQETIPSDGIRIAYAPTLPEGCAGIFIPEIVIANLAEESTVRCNGALSRGSVLQGHELLIYHGKKNLLLDDGVAQCPAGCVFRFDLLQNIFLRLSCAAERQREATRGPSHSYLPKSMRSASYDQPIVNYLLELLMAALRARLPNAQVAPSPRDGKIPAIIFSHDVDALTRTSLKAAKQTAMNVANALRCSTRGRWLQARHLFLKNIGLNWGIDDFNQLNYWRRIDANVPGRSLLHFFIKTPGRTTTLRKRLRAKLFDPEYDVGSNRPLALQIRQLHADGFEVGLHGSYNSDRCVETLREEKQCLEEISGVPCRHIRQHWLRFSFRDTWHVQEAAGFAIDTGFGFNNWSGFRSWCASPYHPWDDSAQKAHTIRVIPMIAMDSTLFDYLLLDEAAVAEKLRTLSAETKKFGGQVNLNWHTHGASRHYNWHHAYAAVAEHAKHL